MWIWDEKQTKQSLIQPKIKDGSRIICYLMTV